MSRNCDTVVLYICTDLHGNLGNFQCSEIWRLYANLPSAFCHQTSREGIRSHGIKCLVLCTAGHIPAREAIIKTNHGNKWANAYDMCKSR